MRIDSIEIQGFNRSLPYFYIVNEDGVTYKGNDLDDLIRFYVIHTAKRATQVGRIG